MRLNHLDKTYSQLATRPVSAACQVADAHERKGNGLLDCDGTERRSGRAGERQRWRSEHELVDTVSRAMLS